eukprot:CAMPEP_0197588924 /NCGR_PEP_ID=MMETSP1326-20131121/10039_1 /TAXON_ID=1155430 /ORGANISM="Genus nov. species nov., Strain RCC2288" /LENGTH=81 /DNA_ID=CAMNT_0043153803 /DNA_START=233 /DNA_END=474 /DNA_ORIENTATION=-
MAEEAEAEEHPTAQATKVKVHHAIELGLNACGVECCPHAPYRRLVAVASYLHRPGDGDDQPQSRVGQLFLYNLTRSASNPG